MFLCLPKPTVQPEEGSPPSPAAPTAATCPTWARPWDLPWPTDLAKPWGARPHEESRGARPHEEPGSAQVPTSCRAAEPKGTMA